MCQLSKIDGRCEIRLLYLLKILILQLYANYAEGLHFSAFIVSGTKLARRDGLEVMLTGCGEEENKFFSAGE